MTWNHFIIGTIAFSQGIIMLSDLAIAYMQKDDYHFDPSQTQFVGTLISLPWIVKPFWGVLTDTVPLCGYRRKSYLMFFGVLGFALWNLLAMYGVENPAIGISILIAINVCIAFCNVIGEALLVELSGHTQDSSNDDSASSNVTFFFGMRSAGTLATAYLQGELLDVFDKRIIFRITSAFPLCLALIALFIKEKKHIKEENKIQTGETLIQFGRFVSQPAIYKPIFLILAFTSCPSVSTAMFYFYTNVLTFGPEFIGELRLAYSVCSIFSAFLFNRFLKNVKFTKVFGYSTVIYFMVSCQTILLATRQNVKMGIPDKVFCFGDGVLNQVVGELNTMPILVLACKMCPKNIEGTMYALLMSAINFGSMISGQIGAIITYYFGVTETDFDNLGLLIFLTSASTLLPLPFLSIIKEDELAKIKEQHEYGKLPKLEQSPDEDCEIIEEVQELVSE